MGWTRGEWRRVLSTHSRQHIIDVINAARAIPDPGASSSATPAQTSRGSSQPSASRTDTSVVSGGAPSVPAQVPDAVAPDNQPYTQRCERKPNKGRAWSMLTTWAADISAHGEPFNLKLRCHHSPTAADDVLCRGVCAAASPCGGRHVCNFVATLRFDRKTKTLSIAKSYPHAKFGGSLAVAPAGVQVSSSHPRPRPWRSNPLRPLPGTACSNGQVHRMRQGSLSACHCRRKSCQGLGPLPAASVLCAVFAYGQVALSSLRRCGMHDQRRSS